MGIALEAEQTVNGPRQGDYGDPVTNLNRIATLWGPVFDQEVTPKQVALAMVLLKVARELGPNPSRDSLVDMIGYAVIADMVDQDNALRARQAEEDVWDTATKIMEIVEAAGWVPGEAALIDEIVEIDKANGLHNDGGPEPTDGPDYHQERAFYEAHLPSFLCGEVTIEDNRPAQKNTRRIPQGAAGFRMLKGH